MRFPLRRALIGHAARYRVASAARAPGGRGAGGPLCEGPPAARPHGRLDDAAEAEDAVPPDDLPDPPGLERLDEVGRAAHFAGTCFGEPGALSGGLGTFSGTGCFSGSTRWTLRGLPISTSSTPVFGRGAAAAPEEARTRHRL